MSEKPRFTIDELVEDVQVPPPDVAVPVEPRREREQPGAYSQSPYSPNDVEEAGLRLATRMEACGYHPVVLFGTAASGKTSLLLSLFSLVRMTPELHAGLFPGDPILDIHTDYGKYTHDNALQFFGQKTQDFIEGRAAPKTVLQYPFFVPVSFRPDNKPEAKFAFMESNGEWYRPDRSNGRLFPVLRRQIEDFIKNYQGGITFIHLVPYTQRAVYSAVADRAGEASEIQDASIAISGALQAYDRIRANKQNDRHLMLVTKWDAHSPPNVSKFDVLTCSPEEVVRFANENYAQALTTFRGIGLNDTQLFLNSYCSGIMNEMGVLQLRQNNELRAPVMSYPIRLWEWLYRGALDASGQVYVEPFPAQPKARPWQAMMDAIGRWLDRLF
jgi:hypothetical protein